MPRFEDRSLPRLCRLDDELSGERQREQKEIRSESQEQGNRAESRVCRRVDVRNVEERHHCRAQDRKVQERRRGKSC